MNENLIFSVGLSLLIIHEMDAIRRREWRMFFGLSKFDDEPAYNIFSLLHIPLLVGILWGLFAAAETVRYYVIWGLDLFFMIHFLLHLLFLKHKSNEFKSIFSWLVIVGLFITGLIHFLIITHKI